MRLAAIAAEIAVIAIPIAVRGAQGRARVAPLEKRTCETSLPTGSRLGSIRRCRSRTGREQSRQEARTVLDHIQAMKPTWCLLQRPC